MSGERKRLRAYGSDQSVSAAIHLPIIDFPGTAGYHQFDPNWRFYVSLILGAEQPLV